MAMKYVWLGGQSREFRWDNTHALDAYGLRTDGRIYTEEQPSGRYDVANIENAVSFYSYNEETVTGNMGALTPGEVSFLNILNNTSGGTVTFSGIDFSTYNSIPRFLLFTVLDTGDAITVVHNDAGIANTQYRFSLSDSADYTIDLGELVIIYYDQKALRWRLNPISRANKAKKVPVVRTTTNLTLNSTHQKVFCDTDGGAIIITLPAGSDGTEYQIINTGSSGNDVTVTPDGTEQIFNGGAGTSFVLADSEGITITYEDTENWW